MTLLMVALGGGAGAMLRFIADRRITELMVRRLAGRSRSFPFGTLAVNVVGSLILGMVTGATGLAAWQAALLGTGFCGGLTTLSTFSLEIATLATGAGAADKTPPRPSDRIGAVLYVVFSVVLGLGAVTLGRAIVGA